MADKLDSSGQNGNGNTVSMLQPISHPVLKSMDPMKVAKFLQERERHDIEVTEKKKEVPSITKATHKVSEDTGLLRHTHYLGELEDVAPGKEFS